MGISGFSTWLLEKYKDIAVTIGEGKNGRYKMVNGVRVPVGAPGISANGFEFDNLYLDMNGIIHPCFHPEGLPPPKTYDEVFENICKYIDKVFSIVQPQKLIFFGVDGVAPRAKMNQQRARRFRAAKEAAEALADNKLMESEGNNNTDLEDPAVLDSNVITPGTEFMELLSVALKSYILLRMNNSEEWKGIKVILSDSHVPGEGEHKIMAFIRLQRDLPGYDPNTRHCLYGLDADLILLALVTHEVHLSILREDVFRGKVVTKFPFHLKLDKKNLLKNLHRKQRNASTLSRVKFVENLDQYLSAIKFKFLKIWTLREHLEHDMRIPGSTFPVDLERLIDDFILMCLFVGNDFLPQIPSLKISKGAIELLMTVYKKEFLQMGGYLTNSFEVDFRRLEHFLCAVASYEDTLVRQLLQQQRSRDAKREKYCRKKLKRRLLKDPNAHSTDNESSLMMGNVGGTNRVIPTNRSSDRTDRDFEMIQNSDDDWKERYYAMKFKVKTKVELESIQRDAVLKYMEGICWIMRYYYNGVCSWQWFYPYHYAPYISDFLGLNQLKIQFTLGEPLKPLEQLLGVLPAASAHALPTCYRKLMTDESSPILDFYPSDFETDMNGKRHAWQAICLLPFIDEARLLSEVSKAEGRLTDDERQRNDSGSDFLYVHISHPLATAIIHLSEQNCDPNMFQIIDPKLSGGVNGFFCISDEAILPKDEYLPNDGMRMISHNRVVSVLYRYPLFHQHISRLPEGVILPPKRKEIGASKMTTNNGCKGGERREGENILQNLRQCNPSEHKDDNCYPGTVMEINKIQLAKQKRRKERKKLKKIKMSEGTGNVDKILVQLDHGIHKSHRQSEVNNNIENIGGSSNADILVSYVVNDKSLDNDIKNMGSSTDAQREVSDVIIETSLGDETHVGPLALMEIKTQEKSKKHKRKSGKKEQAEVDDYHACGENIVRAAAFLESSSAVPRNNVEKLSSSNCFEQINGNVEKCGGHSFAENSCLGKSENDTCKVMEIKGQVKSKKRKQKSSDIKQIDVNDGLAIVDQQESASGPEETTNAVSRNNIEKMTSFDCKERINGIVKKLSCICNAERMNLGDFGNHSNMSELSPQVKSKKRKRKPGKKKQNVDGNLNSCREQARGVGGLVESTSAVTSSDVKNLESSGQVGNIADEVLRQINVSNAENGSLEKLDYDLPKNQGETCVRVATMELIIKEQVESKRKKRRLKWRVVPEKTIEKFNSGFLGKHPETDGDNVSANVHRTESQRTDVQEFERVANNLKDVRDDNVGKLVVTCDDQAVLHSSEEIKIERCAVQLRVGTNELDAQAQIKTKKKKRKSKKKNVLGNSFEKLETDGSSLQAEHDGRSVGTDGVVSLSEAQDSVIEIALGRVALGMVANEPVILAQTKSKRKKRRLNEIRVVDNGVEKLESGGQTKQSGNSSNKAGENGAVAKSEEKSDGEFTGVLNSVVDVSSGKEVDDDRKQVGGSGAHAVQVAAADVKSQSHVVHVNINALDAQVETKSKKKRKAKRTVPDNGVEKLESGGQAKQAETDGNNAGANGAVAKSEEKSDGEFTGVLSSAAEASSGKEVNDDRKQVGGSGAHAVQVAAADVKSQSHVVHVNINALDAQAETKPKKKKRKAKKTVADNGVEKLESGGQTKQAETDGNNAGANEAVAKPEEKSDKDFTGFSNRVVLASTGKEDHGSEQVGVADNHAVQGARGDAKSESHVFYMDTNALDALAETKLRTKKRRAKSTVVDNNVENQVL